MYVLLLIKVIWRGVCFKLLEALAKEVGFTYTVEIEATVFGSMNLTSGGWNGLIGDLANNRTDMAVQLITENAKRRQESGSSSNRARICQ